MKNLLVHSPLFAILIQILLCLLNPQLSVQARSISIGQKYECIQTEHQKNRNKRQLELSSDNGLSPNSVSSYDSRMFDKTSYNYIEDKTSSYYSPETDYDDDDSTITMATTYANKKSNQVLSQTQSNTLEGNTGNEIGSQKLTVDVSSATSNTYTGEIKLSHVTTPIKMEEGKVSTFSTTEDLDASHISSTAFIKDDKHTENNEYEDSTIPIETTYSSEEAKQSSFYTQSNAFGIDSSYTSSMAFIKEDAEAENIDYEDSTISFETTYSNEDSKQSRFYTQTNTIGLGASYTPSTAFMKADKQTENIDYEDSAMSVETTYGNDGSNQRHTDANTFDENVNTEIGSQNLSVDISTETSKTYISESKSSHITTPKDKNPIDFTAEDLEASYTTSAAVMEEDKQTESVGYEDSTISTETIYANKESKQNPFHTSTFGGDIKSGTKTSPADISTIISKPKESKSKVPHTTASKTKGKDKNQIITSTKAFMTLHTAKTTSLEERKQFTKTTTDKSTIEEKQKQSQIKSHNPKKIQHSKKMSSTDKSLTDKLTSQLSSVQLTTGYSSSSFSASETSILQSEIPTTALTSDSHKLENKIVTKVSNFENINNTNDNYTHVADLESTVKTSLMNTVRMNFDLDIPDSNFTLNVERKDVNNDKKRFQKLHNKNTKHRKFTSFKRQYSHLKQKKCNVIARSKRSIQSLMPYLKDSQIEKKFQSGKVMPWNKRFLTTFSTAVSVYREAKRDKNLKSKFSNRLLQLVSRNNTKRFLKPKIENLPVKSTFFSAYKNNNIQHNLTNNEKLNNSTAVTDIQNKTFFEEIANGLSPKDSQKLLNLIKSNLSNPYTNSYIRFEGENTIYILNKPTLENDTLPKDIKILKMLKKSHNWDHFHSIRERTAQNKRNSAKIWQNILEMVKQNPFTIALILVVLSGVAVLMLTVVYCIAENRFKNPKPPRSNLKNGSDYKIIKYKKSIKFGTIEENLTSSEEEESKDMKNSKIVETSNSSDSEDSNIESHNKWKKHKAKKENNISNIKHDRPKQKYTKNTKDSEEGYRCRALKWLLDKITAIPLPGVEKRFHKCEENLRNHKSNSDINHISKHHQRKRFEKTRSDRKNFHNKAKVMTHDLQTAIIIHPYSTDDDVPIPNLPDPDLKEKIVATGDCKLIDNILVGGEWEDTFYAAHGLDKINAELHLLDHSPEERKKLNIKKIEAVSALSPGNFGTLPLQNSSSYSFKKDVEKSIYAAEWVMKHARPVPKSILKTKYVK